MTDEQLHEYWQTVDEKDKKKHRKLKRFFIILTVIFAILTPIYFYLFGWVRLSAEDIQPYINIEDNTVYVCFSDFPVDLFDLGTYGIKYDLRPVGFGTADYITYDYENDIKYYALQYWFLTRRIYLWLPKDNFVIGDKYSLGGEWLNTSGYEKFKDENGIMHTFHTRISEIYYENPDGELVLLHTFDSYSNNDKGDIQP